MSFNTPAPTPPAMASASCLVEIVELKWLMAGHGVRVHVEQLQQDPEYARRLLAQADGMANPALREAALRLRSCLGLNPTCPG